ncbi:MAG: AAA family ATPase [Synechococcaceae cyanobacterium SM2_3_2]|nr:AAA family ATPase [Synechococcaceae cyanobacterium SM2_3_2]
MLQQILNQWSGCRTEQEVERNVVAPLLGLLGYGSEDWHQQVMLGGSRLDFLVCPVPSAHPPFLVVECKGPRQTLDHGLWQLQSYMQRSGAIFGLLTNGHRFRLIYQFDGHFVAVLDVGTEGLIQSFGILRQMIGYTTAISMLKAFAVTRQRLDTIFLQRLEHLLIQQGSHCFDVQSLQSALAHPISPQAMIITVFNNKGGVGKTTLTINLAAALNQLHKKVLVIDIDPQANLTTGLGIDPLSDIEHRGRKDITDLLLDPTVTLQEAIYKRRWPNNVTLDIVPSHIRLSDKEPDLIRMIDSDNVLSRKLKKYQQNYDYILIDPPPSFSKVNAISLMASSSVLIPIQLSPYPIRALEYVFNRVQQVSDAREDPLSVIGIAVSMYNKTATRIADEMTDEVTAVLARDAKRRNVALFPEKTWIPHRVVLNTSSQKGYPLSMAEKDATVSLAERKSAEEVVDCYTKLAHHLIQQTSPTQTATEVTTHAPHE